MDRDAVGLDAAVPATLADQVIDQDALGRVGEGAALAAASLFRGAGLVVDQGTGAHDFAQLALHLVDLVAVVDRHACRPDRAGWVFFRFISDNDDARHAFGAHLVRNGRHVEVAVVALPARHRHRVVEQDLVGDVGLGRNRGADRQQSRMEVSAIADVLEHVLATRERRLADPRHALGPHLGVAGGGPVHRLRHPAAADAGIALAALGQHGRRAVWTTTAEVEAAAQDVDHALGRAVGPQRFDPLAQCCVVVQGQQALADGDRHLVGIERHLGLEQCLTLFVELADDGRHVTPAIELLLELRLDQAALFLDHQDLVQTDGEFGGALRLQRPGHADLVETQTQPGGGLLRKMQIVKRLKHVEVALAVADDTQLGRRTVDDGPVDPVAARKSPYRAQFVAMQPGLLRMRRVGLTYVDAIGRPRHAFGQGDPNPIDVDIDRGCGLDRVLDAFHADPATAVTRQRPAQHAVIQDLLHTGRAEHRNHRVDHREFALMAGGRRLAGVVVAHQHQHAAQRRRPGQVAMAESVAGTVDARALAVPEREHPVVLALAADLGLLRTPDRGGCQVFVDPGHENDVVRVEMLLGLAELVVQATQR